MSGLIGERYFHSHGLPVSIKLMIALSILVSPFTSIRMYLECRCLTIATIDKGDMYLDRVTSQGNL